MNMYDVIIIGGGPGGLTAAVYTSREGLSTLLLERGFCGGMPAVTGIIENYPGFPDGIKGEKLTEYIKKQAEKFGTVIKELDEVTNISPAGKIIKIKTSKEEYVSKTLIISSGSVPRKIDIPGEKEYTGRGVSYCAICDGPLYRDKIVLVVGGGNAAVEEALFLTKFARQVILVHRRKELRADNILQERLKNNKKIKIILNHIALSIKGKETVQSVTIKDKESNKEAEIELSGVFIYIGFLSNTKFTGNSLKLDNSGFIITNSKMETSHPGIYAVGDVRSKEVRQIAVACGEAVIAAIAVREYLKK